MKWRGIQRGSIDVSKTAEEGLLAINTRFKVNGELRRRRGIARSNIIKKDNAVNQISGFSAFQSNVMAALVDGSNLQGYQQPAALWGDNPDYTYTPQVFLPVFEFSYSGGYCGDPSINVTTFTPTWIESSSAVPSIFPGGSSWSGKFKHVFTANTDQDFVISMDYTAGRTYGAGSPTDYGGIIAIGVKNVGSSIYIPQAYPPLTPSTPWWDRASVALYHCVYTALTYSWAVTKVYP